MSKSYLVTGGCGFIGTALVKRLVQTGCRVRVLDNLSRGDRTRLDSVAGDVEFVEADIRDAAAVERAVKGVDSVCHAAFINGTRHFYSQPELVLDVGVRGIVHVLQACLKHDVGELILVSSSEVYQTPPHVPTDESVPLSIPDPLNPRYSYAAGKIISEIMAINYGRTHLNRVLIVRPHNVYGPDMGCEHVVPQFVIRMKRLAGQTSGRLRFPIQGTGHETRAFVYIDDFIDGLLKVIQHGRHMEIYNVGTSEELAIADVARMVAGYFGREIEIVPGESTCGSPSRRCPDITKLEALGFSPGVSFSEGLAKTAQWYDENSQLFPANAAVLEKEEPPS